MSELRFEVFIPPGRQGPMPGRKRNAALTVLGTGEMQLSQPAYKALGSPAYVELGFNRERGLVAVRAAPAGAASAIRVGRVSAEYMGRFTARAFLRAYNIHIPRSTRIDAEVEGGAVLVDVSAYVDEEADGD